MKKNKEILIIILIILIYLIFSNITGIAVPCIFHSITGLLCPGCGSTRMFKSILLGNFKKAFYYNQLLFISLPIFIILLINYLYSNYKNVKPIINKIPKYIYYGYIVILIIFGIIRNII